MTAQTVNIRWIYYIENMVNMCTPQMVVKYNKFKCLKYITNGTGSPKACMPRIKLPAGIAKIDRVPLTRTIKKT